jgi:periplasmic divalent cation tolerance protein
MKTTSRYVVVFVTAPSVKVARQLARAALAAHLIGCANVIPKIESHYLWRGKIQTATEVLLVMKTTRPRISALEKLLLSKHPYDTPEFIVLPLMGGNKRYLDWLGDSVHSVVS